MGHQWRLLCIRIIHVIIFVTDFRIDLTEFLYVFPPPNIPFTGTLTVEEVYKDRDQFAALVREVAAPDVGRMGIEILSFTIKDVYDDVQYLASLGKAQTASVKRDADTGVAEANRWVSFDDDFLHDLECTFPE